MSGKSIPRPSISAAISGASEFQLYKASGFWALSPAKNTVQINTVASLFIDGVLEQFIEVSKH